MTTPIAPSPGTDPQLLQVLQQENAALRAELARLSSQLSDVSLQAEQFASILNHLPVMVGYWDANLVNRYANKAYQDWFGVEPTRVLGHHLRDVLGDDLYRLNLPYVQGALAGKRQQFEREIPNTREKRIRYSLAQYIPDVVNGVVQGFIALVMDVSALKESEQELRRNQQSLTTSRQLLRAMAIRNESRIERERKHLAHEVHDELGQLLTALRVDVVFLDLQFGSAIPALGARVQEMKAVVDSAIAAVRNVTTHLRPVVLDLGLVDAIRWLCREFTRKTGVDCQLEACDAPPVLDEQCAVVVFRIVQESLTNITRHAQARTVCIRIRPSDAGSLIAQVQDDGVGFNVHLPGAATTYGLLGMQERALALGGEVHIASTLGEGTLVTVTIPLHPKDAP